LERATWTEIVPGVEPVGGNDTVVAVWLLTWRVAVRAVLVLFVYVRSATATPVFAAVTPV